MRGCEQQENFPPEGDVSSIRGIAVAMLPADARDGRVWNHLHDIAKPQCRAGGRATRSRSMGIRTTECVAANMLAG